MRKYGLRLDEEVMRRVDALAKALKQQAAEAITAAPRAAACPKSAGRKTASPPAPPKETCSRADVVRGLVVVALARLDYERPLAVQLPPPPVPARRRGTWPRSSEPPLRVRLLELKGLRAMRSMLAEWTKLPRFDNRSPGDHARFAALHVVQGLCHLLDEFRTRLAQGERWGLRVKEGAPDPGRLVIEIAIERIEGSP